MRLYTIGDNFIHTIKTAVRLRTGAELHTCTREPYLPFTGDDVERPSTLLAEALS
ncbi:hypothetical protein [Corynebacterium glucuronolyticum]|uniref:Uncharacterized protein n=2 Tax=Corynebacterium glucuronolyticum TaxID=39791 RepID=A0AAX1L8G6_9CORY|nr:hypothetical protein [Corynebacterium glucuronolyticum]EEI63934.1 hypothetical protein HMPREF0293_0565 [Corynebacterium glucuronolyticum ATCC 51866]QRP70739.1 hypothetical protein I6J21_00750 [Corynebacterium glucuronolyticum]